MISRLWRGWTTLQNADAYERLLRTEVFPGIMARRIPGFHGIQLLRRATEGETEFVTLMWFESVDAVRAFAGNDHERAVVPASARQLLSRFEERSTHFELREHQVP
ncbi:MAG TPA: antibiotic biosynthesis monooxygenase [Gemmatimonadales bacterium]|nr:antibiotic biosynthesis monooxygenase [Gemmatimonadales bacterium]